MVIRLSRYERAATFRAVKIGRPKSRLLITLARFGYLSAEQLTGLLYSPKSLTFVRDHLKEIFHAGFVKRLYQPNPMPYGSPLAICVLDKKGVAYTETPAPDTEVGFFFLRHTLAANQLIVLSRLLERMDPASQLMEYRTERELKKMAGSWVIPDGWVHIRRQWPNRSAHNQHYIAWELDRGTIEQRAFRKKLRALVEWVENDYTRQFGVTGLTIAFVLATASPKRLQEVIRWTQDELQHSPYRHNSELFLFASFDPHTAEPGRVFLEPIWRVPFSNQLVPLLAAP